MKQIFVFVLTFLVITISSAEEKSKDHCAGAKTQADMDQCVQVNRQEIEKDLAGFIDAYEKRLTAEQAQLFEKAQAAWDHYRTRSCEFNTIHSLGGSAHAMALTICMTEKARERLDELRTLSRCKEGDLGCPFFENK